MDKLEMNIISAVHKIKRPSYVIHDAIKMKYSLMLDFPIEVYKKARTWKLNRLYITNYTRKAIKQQDFKIL